jgi:steroid 5-alpha reductase family enzyme
LGGYFLVCIFGTFRVGPGSAVISPIWIIIFLVAISGIPLIEVANKKKYAGNADFQKYVSKTWRLIPFVY